jgi:hypothetical protein
VLGEGVEGREGSRNRCHGGGVGRRGGARRGWREEKGAGKRFRSEELGGGEGQKRYREESGARDDKSWG